MVDLCRWKCPCTKKGNPKSCDLDSLTSWICDTNSRLLNRKGRRLFPELVNQVGLLPSSLRPYEPPPFLDLFPRWREEMRRENREYCLTTAACSRCSRHLPSMRCSEKFCQWCCQSRECKMHRDCCECRQRKVDTTKYPKSDQNPIPTVRDCIKSYYDGYGCDTRAQATGHLGELKKRVGDVRLLYAIPGRLTEEMEKPNITSD